MIALDMIQITITDESKARRFYRCFIRASQIAKEYKVTSVSALRYIKACKERYPDSVCLVKDNILGFSYYAVNRTILAKYITQEKRHTGNPMFKDSEYQRQNALIRHNNHIARKKRAENLKKEGFTQYPDDSSGAQPVSSFT